jgi:anti-sigma regulatory factor (Ser/Thr protein kinase)
MNTGGTAGPNTPLPVIQTFRAHPSALYEVRRFVRERGGESSLPPQVIEDLILAVSEACANSIIHTASRDIRVTWLATGECVEIEVRDRGVFKRHVRMAELDGRGSHGIPLMMALVDEFSVREGTPANPGTLVRLVKCVDG